MPGKALETDKCNTMAHTESSKQPVSPVQFTEKRPAYGTHVGLLHLGRNSDRNRN